MLNKDIDEECKELDKKVSTMTLIVELSIRVLMKISLVVKNLAN